MAPRDELQTQTKEKQNCMSAIPQKIVFPLPPDLGDDTVFEMDVYARFMRHLRRVPNSRMEIKILSSIQFTADVLDISDALIAKTLVDLGLRAPRKAFPVSFLDFVDKAIQRQAWEHGPQQSPPISVTKLRHHWDQIGEQRITAVVPGKYSVCREGMYARS